MDKASLLESLKALAEAVELSCKIDVTDAGAVVIDILDDTDISCTYETVRKIVSAITSYSDNTKMSLAKCLKEDGWIDGQCDGSALNIKVAGLGVPMEREAQQLYEGLNYEQKELLARLLAELVPLLLRDEDVHVNGLEEIVDNSDLEEWAEENGWKHPDKDSIDDFTDNMPSSDVRDWVAGYIKNRL